MLNGEHMSEVVLYKDPAGAVSLEVKLVGETVWLDAHQMAKLFGRDRTVIVRHVGNVYKTKELDPASTCAENAQVAADGKIRRMDLYNLDMILSVGYRVNSKQGTQFRIWATQVLREHIVRGYTLNEARLRQDQQHLEGLQKAIGLIGRVLDTRELAASEATGLLKVIADYSAALVLLDDYDHKRLTLAGGTAAPAGFALTYETARAAVDRLAEQPAFRSSLFGREKDQGFKGLLGAIYQSFGGQDLYPTIEEKAAHLLYFVVKNHPFSDGNKRIGAFLFLWFLDAHGLLYLPDGRKRLVDATLVALTLLIAESKPSEKEVMVAVIVNLVNRKSM